MCVPAIVRQFRQGALLLFFCLAPNTALAQTLVPRAYVITPIDANAITVTYNYQNGDILFDPSIPIKDAGAQLNTTFLSYYHAFNFFGRSANVAATLPYAVGTLSGTLIGSQRSLYRSGLTDSGFRLSVNLKGGPAMGVADMQDWRQKTLLGVSLTVQAPTGQYDPHHLINPGSNRWAFKPELGFSKRWRSWVLDAYAGLWFFTENGQYYPGVARQTEQPIGSFETHLSYDLRSRLWFSLDGNFWTGGAVTLNGVENVITRQESSRVGATASVPLNKHQSLKFSYSVADHVSFGGDFQSVAAGWQYSWIGKP